MADGPPAGDAETQATDAGIASDETLRHDSATPTPPHASTGPIIRPSRPSGQPMRLGRYLIVKQLGRGGMGAVYEAEDPELGRRVAIKVLRDDRHDAQFTEGLRREAQALAKLVHPNVVSVYDVGVDEGNLFVVMQLINGESIDRSLHARKARMPEILAAFRAAGRGLAAAHAAGLVHCDFKPSNVLVDQDGVVRVSDFGLARMGAEGEEAIAGTPSYMPPEQFTGVATAASDQYAFCVALIEVLNGEAPFASSKITDIDAAKARVLPIIPRAPAYVVRALHRGLASDPAQRFPSMDALLDALAPPAWRKWAIAGVAAVLVLAGTVLATSALHSKPAVERVADAGVVGVPDLAAAGTLTKYGRSACAYAPAIAGDQVVFDRTEGDAVDLYAMPLSGGTPRQLTSAPTWEWRSNPGRNPGEVMHLIDDPTNAAAARIAYLDVATGKETIAANVPATDATATSHAVIYVPKGGAAVRKIEGDKDTVVAAVPEGHVFNQLAISHRGDQVALVAHMPGDSLLCIVDLVTGKSDCFKILALEIRVAFGSDDRSIYYAAKDGIHRHELASHQDALIVPDVLAQGGVTVSGDGRTLVYSDCGPHSSIVDWTEQPPKTLVDDPLAREADGIDASTFAYVRTVRGVGVLVVHTPDGHDRQLTEPSFGQVSEPAMNPEGDRIAFRVAAPHAGIYTIEPYIASTAQRVSDDPHDYQPVWIGHSKLAFSRGDESGAASVFTARIDGAELERATPNMRFAIGGRNGRLLVASTAHMNWIDLEHHGAESAGPDFGSLEISRLRMSPDGRWLIFRSGPEEMVIYRMRLDGPGKPEPERLPALPGGETLAGASITNDGHVLLSPETWSGDLHVVPAKADSRF